MNKWVLSSFIAVLLLSSTLGSPGVSASTLTDMQQKKQELEAKKQNLNLDINQKNTEISTNKSTINNITAQIDSLSVKINDTNSKIEKLEAEIESTTKEIEALHASIQELEKRIAERDVVLRERVRTMQVNDGTVNYIDVLLGANSFSDFIDRFSAVTSLMEADRDIMTEQANDQKLLEEEKALVEKRLAEQEANKEELNNLKATLETQKAKNNELVKSLEVEQAKLVNEKSGLQTEFNETLEVSKEIEASIIAEQNRLAEVARKAAEEQQRKQEAERAAAAAAAANNSTNNSSTGNTSTSSNSTNNSNPSKPTVTAPPVSSGSWTRPTTGRVTSGFGYRNISYGSKQHRGTDIANSAGTPIVAAGSGVVSYAGILGTYGNVVMITHSVGGQTYTTLYAHMSGYGVSVGQQVSKGQYIGAMGGTGAGGRPQFGVHLHFEFHIGNWSSKGSSAQNPVNHVPI